MQESRPPQLQLAQRHKDTRMAMWVRSSQGRAATPQGGGQHAARSAHDIAKTADWLQRGRKARPGDGDERAADAWPSAWREVAEDWQLVVLVRSFAQKKVLVVDADIDQDRLRQESTVKQWRRDAHDGAVDCLQRRADDGLSLIHISEPTRRS
eukprot:6618435-Prymnesium_polylepis.4